MNPKPPFAVRFQTTFPYETQIIDSNNDVVFELKFEKFGNAFEEVDFIEKIVDALNKP